MWRAFHGASSAARRPGCFILSVPSPPGVRSLGLGAGPGRHRPAHAPGCSLLPESARLCPAPPRPGAFASGRSGPARLRARMACPRGGGQSGTMRAFLFVLSWITRVSTQSPKRAAPRVALVRASWARWAPGPEGGPAAPRTARPRPPPTPSPRPPGRRGAHAGSGRALAGDRVLGPRRPSPCRGCAGSPPAFSTSGRGDGSTELLLCCKEGLSGFIPSLYLHPV